MYKKNWNDSFENIYDNSINIYDNKELKFQINRNKDTGELSLNIRQFIISAKYTGATKNGFFQSVSNEDALNVLESSFMSLFQELRKNLK